MVFEGWKHIHFIGIGGISMSALAAFLHSRGHTVSGSDLVHNDQTRMLEELGIKIFIGHKSRNIRDCVGDCIIVINSAISPQNKELVCAQKHGLKIISREETLAEIQRGYPVRIAVAGTHGKSTTTAMIYAVLYSANLNPTVHNGAVMVDASEPCDDEVEQKSKGYPHSPFVRGCPKKNYVIGGNEIFLTEACEFKRNFLSLNPTVAVVTNIDADHLDCYSGLEDIKETFAKFAMKADVLVKNPDCPNSRNLRGKKNTLNFADYDIKLSIPGSHNVANARAAAAVCQVLGVNRSVIKKALYEFKGIERRFEKIGEVNGTGTSGGGPETYVNDKDGEKTAAGNTERCGKKCDLISDYAHHPTEIKAAVATARELYRKFFIVFQPHTYTRTLLLFRDFVRALEGCDCVLYKTYAAREKPIEGGTAENLAAALGREYIDSAKALRKFVAEKSAEYDAIILTGAGDMVYIFK